MMKTTQIFTIFILMIYLSLEINAQYFGGFYSGSKSVEFNNYKIVNEIFYGGYNDGFTSNEFNNYKIVTEMFRGGDNDGYYSNQIYLLNIPLNAGWNLISSHIQPQVPDSMNIVLDDVAGNMLIAKDISGAVYIPAFDINTIGSWDVTQGYQLYMSQADTLTVIGNEVVPSETPIKLTSGWNMIAYLLNYELTAEIAFASITDNENLLIAKTLDGRVYIPSYQINTIGNMKPGVGYRVYVTNPDIFYYNQDTVYYETVTIGTQVWMKKNLGVRKYRNGDNIRYAETVEDWVDANNKGEGAWCYYDNEPAKGATFGKLYNWFAVNDPRGLAPYGFHIPSDVEWTTITNYLGGQNIAGGAMKEIGTTLWYAPNEGATNSSGFTGLPGGYRFGSGGFYDMRGGGAWWSSNQYSTTHSWYRYLSYNNTIVLSNNITKMYGMSVRCIKD